MTEKITIVIPTLCRSTLDQSLKSIHNQTSNAWNVIVVTDGIDPMNVPNPKMFDDDRIKIVRAPETHSPFLTRKYGVALSENDWVGFLDDDDILNPEFVSEWSYLKDGYDGISFRKSSYDDNRAINLCANKNYLDEDLNFSGTIYVSDYVAYQINALSDGIKL